MHSASSVRNVLFRSASQPSASLVYCDVGFCITPRGYYTSVYRVILSFFCVHQRVCGFKVIFIKDVKSGSLAYLDKITFYSQAL